MMSATSPFAFRCFAAVGCLVLTALLVAPSAAQDPGKPRPSPAPAPARPASERVSLPAPPAERAGSSQSPRDKVARLERENVALRARVKELEAQVDQLKRRRAVTVVPQPGPGGAVPPEWKRVPFNGGFYYIVPLEKTAGDSKTLETPARPAPQLKQRSE